MKILMTMLVAASVTTPLAAQNGDTQKQLLAARDTIWRAWYNNDTTLLRRFLPPAAASVEGSNARWSDRRQIVDGSRGFAQGKAKLLDIKFTNTRVTQNGQSALVRSNYQTIVQSGTRTDTAIGRATELFVRIGNTWVNPYWQLEPLKNLQDAGHDIPIPDSTGASFEIADSTKALGSLTDYDALIGVWEFRYQSRKPDGTFAPAFTGHWTWEKKPGSGLIEDRWRPDNTTTAMGNSLYTYRLFDPQKKVWQIIGASSSGGEVQPGITWSDGKDLLVMQHGRNGISRIRYFAIDANHFLWRSDYSTDNGKTWNLDVGMMEATRIAK